MNGLLILGVLYCGVIIIAAVVVICRVIARKRGSSSGNNISDSCSCHLSGVVINERSGAPPPVPNPAPANMEAVGMALLDTEPVVIGRTLWVRWSLATAMSMAFFNLIGEIFRHPILDSDSMFVAIVITGGAVIGILQWLVLRAYVKKATLWILATTIGFALPGLLAVMLDINTPPRFAAQLWSSVQIGCSLGIVQLLVLRLWVSKTSWWVAAAIAGEVVALLARGVSMGVLQRGFGVGGLMQFTVSLTVAGGIGGAAAGAVTGFTMMRLLQVWSRDRKGDRWN